MLKQLAFFLCIIFSHYAMADDCQRLPTVAVNAQVEVYVGDFPISVDYTSAQIRSMSGGSGGDVLGLFRGGKRFSLKRQGVSSAQCAKITQVRVRVDFSPSIFLASETQGLSCIYSSTYQHEMQHYQNSYQAVYKARDLLTAEIQRLYGPAIVGQNAQEIENYLAQRDQILKEFFSRITDTHALDDPMDTPENYNRESERCPIPERQVLRQRIKGY